MSGTDPKMHITDLKDAGPTILEQAARMIVDAFREHWPDLLSARREVADCIEPGRIALVALDPSLSALGWIGARPKVIEFDMLKHGLQTWRLDVLQIVQAPSQGPPRGIVSTASESSPPKTQNRS